MARPLAALLCASSLLLFQSACADTGKVRLLKQEQLEEPALVSAWLRAHAATADKKRAALAFEEGVMEARRNGLGPALKAFGLSALLLPTPQALNGYADTLARLLGPIRERDKDRATHLDRDLRSFEALYRSALASDDVLATMTAQERRETSANADCIAAYRRDRSGLDACAPLQRYGLRRN